MKLSEIQFKILTGHKAWYNGEYHKINIFYEADSQFVKDNIDLARTVYNDIYKFQFFPTYFQIYGIPFPCHSEMKELKIYETIGN